MQLPSKPTFQYITQLFFQDFLSIIVPLPIKTLRNYYTVNKSPPLYQIGILRFIHTIPNRINIVIYILIIHRIKQNNPLLPLRQII